MKELLAVVIGVLFMVQLQDEIEAKTPKYAPKYCLRFKFDCTSEEKKGHVCCLFPLPIDGNGLEDKTAVPDAGLFICDLVIDVNHVIYSRKFKGHY